MSNTTQETLELIKTAQAQPNDAIAKAWDQASSAVSGITGYDLEPAAKLLYPVITPLRNKTPRVSGGFGIQANWRAITGINTAALSPGVSHGNRGGVHASATADYIAAFRGLGLEDYVTFEGAYAAKGFDDLRALAVEGLLRALMIAEEKTILGGNTSVALGVTPLPTLAAGTSGSLATSTQSVICVALTLDGYLNSSVANGVPALISRTNADSSTDSYGGGSAQKSANATVAVTGPSGSVSASITAVKGAFGYAWYWGAAGSEVLGAITPINSVLITAAAGGTQTAASMPSADNSTNGLVFDGLLSIICKSNSNSYYAAQATGTAGTGTPLTSDNAGGINEIDAALKSFWDNYRLSPSTIWVNSQEQMNIAKKILAASSTSAQRFVFNVDQGVLAGGAMVRSYLNKYTMDGAAEIPIRIHPNMPPGTLMFDTDRLPYPLSNVAAVTRMLMRQDYYQLEWPRRSRKYEYGVYCDGVLQNYFPPAFGIITNIANG